MSKSPIEVLLDEVDFTPTNIIGSEDGSPYVTHEGKLKLGEVEIQVYVLNTGQRIIPEEEIVRLFGPLPY